MDIFYGNPFYDALTNVKHSTETILKIWTHLLNEGVSGFQNRNLMAIVCKRNDINLFLFLIHNNFKFDKLAIYILAFLENINFIEMLFQYQAFDNLNFEHLKEQLIEKKLYQIVDFFENR